MSAGTKVTVNVKDNNVEFALRKFKTQVARNGDLSRAKKRAEGYTPRGVKLREEKKQNIINSRKKNRRNYYWNCKKKKYFINISFSHIN